MSSSGGYNEVFSAPITALKYRDMADVLQDRASQTGDSVEESGAAQTDEGIMEAQMAAAIERERAEAVRETELRVRREYEHKLEMVQAQLTSAIASFDEQRNDYFARVESEVVQLALAIAAKILHREAQVDTMLLATLVRIAIEKLREGSSVSVRVHPSVAANWRQFMTRQLSTAQISIIEDAQLNDQDCVVETELGSANFGLDTQLKEVEQGFFDLLALRPGTR